MKKKDEITELLQKLYGFSDEDLLRDFPWNIAKIVKEMCAKAGIEPRDFRSLRHSHATVLLSHGVHPKVVQERLGHTDFDITMEFYSFVAPTIQREAAQVMDDLHVFPVVWAA